MIFLNNKFECLQTPLIQYDDKFGEWIIQLAASKINQHNIISNIINNKKLFILIEHQLIFILISQV